MSIRVLTIGHSYVVGQNQAVPAAIAKHPDIELTLMAPARHHGDLRPLTLERRSHPDYEIVPIRAWFTRNNHTTWYDQRTLKATLESGRFDVVHAWEEPYTLPGYQVGRAAKRAGTKFFFRTAQSLVKTYRWPFGMFERKTLERADGWVAGGGLVYDAMTRKGFPADRGRVITLGVDMAHFRPAEQNERQATLDSLALKPPVIGFIGRLVEAKGFDVLMAALEQVREPWSLLALGSGPYEQRINTWAEQHGWSGRVRVLLATHDEMPRYINAMDLLVAPSQTTPAWKEQFGRMLIEAFACRVPVIGSDSGEIPYVIDDAGVVVAEADSDAWAEAITRLLEDADLRNELARKGFERCKDRYDVHAVAGKYVEFYNELVGSEQ
jgi:glycosyltransferase involved in cell wall biosynthesis